LGKIWVTRGKMIGEKKKIELAASFIDAPDRRF